MTIKLESLKEQAEVKRYAIQSPLSAYTFPTEARIHQVRIDEKYIHIELMDERILSIPLWWIPTLHNADMEERAKVEINRSRTMLIWDPAKCAINDELRISDYLGPCRPRSEDTSAHNPG
jgi:hypothetical protein